ncbi:MAG: isoprenylcysteine carboxylmethyltransferase family protein [Terracidiphilus sp.]|jgi:protein-S-isoprenylcysteine O-methyltransferase Ste14
MGATKIEFRLRMAIMAMILTLGFSAPWMSLWQMGPRIPLVMWLALELSRHGLVTFSVGLPLVIVLATLTAAKGMVFRVWGAANLGPAIVIHGKMRGDALVASGPYRYVRNPLYIGLWAMTGALAFLMPPTGALFVLIAVPVFLLRLTLGEEAFLTGELGQPYRDYLRAVPRLVPRVGSTLPPSTGKPQWLHAVFAEFTSIGVFFGLASFFWSYNFLFTEKIILVCFGISLVVRALSPKVEQSSSDPPF